MLEAAVSVAIVCGSALLGLRMWLAHREKRFTHEPLAVLEQRQTVLESKMAGLQMRR